MTDLLLTDLPLRPSSQQLFDKRGFSSTREVQDSKQAGLSNLAAELAVSLPEAAALYREVQDASRAVLPATTISSSSTEANTVSSNTIPTIPRRVYTANELLEQSSRQSPQQSIITFSRPVDQMLDGGIALGELTELSGGPGVGKTQLAIQLAVNTRLPFHFGGVTGQTLYIDTEGSFAPERCWAVANALVQHVQNMVLRRQPPSSTPNTTNMVPAWFTAETILHGIHVFRVHDQASQIALLHSLPHLIDEYNALETVGDNNNHPVKLIVIDSMAFHYRASPPGTDFIQRTKALTQLASFLTNVAAQYQIAVVAINQMTTKIAPNNNNNSRNGSSSSRLVPALGESWAHAVTTRLLLTTTEQQDGRRVCHLTKSPRLPSGAADYQILESGIRGTEFIERPTTSQPGSQFPTNQYAKRLRVT